jgi:ABC-type multidrug transport system fused ATPase/permease subunit
MVIFCFIYLSLFEQLAIKLFIIINKKNLKTCYIFSNIYIYNYFIMAKIGMISFSVVQLIFSTPIIIIALSEYNNAIKKEDSDQEIKIAKKLNEYNNNKERIKKMIAENLEEIKTLKKVNRLKDAEELEGKIKSLNQEEKSHDSSIEYTKNTAKISADENKKKISEVKDIAIACIVISAITLLLYAILFIKRNAEYDSNKYLFNTIYTLLVIFNIVSYLCSLVITGYILFGVWNNYINNIKSHNGYAWFYLVFCFFYMLAGLGFLGYLIKNS